MCCQIAVQRELSNHQLEVIKAEINYLCTYYFIRAKCVKGGMLLLLNY